MLHPPGMGKLLHISWGVLSSISKLKVVSNTFEYSAFLYIMCSFKKEKKEKIQKDVLLLISTMNTLTNYCLLLKLRINLKGLYMNIYFGVKQADPIIFVWNDQESKVCISSIHSLLSRLIKNTWLK